MTLDLAKIKSDAEIIASRCDMLLMTLPVRDVLAMVAEIERLNGCDKAYAEAWEKARSLQSEMDDIIAERDQLKAENEALRKSLTYIRDTTDDWHVAEKAADALADTKDRP